MTARASRSARTKPRRSKRTAVATSWATVPSEAQGDLVDLLLFGRHGAKTGIERAEWYVARLQRPNTMAPDLKRMMRNARRDLIAAGDRLAGVDRLGWEAPRLRERIDAAAAVLWAIRMDQPG